MSGKRASSAKQTSPRPRRRKAAGPAVRSHPSAIELEPIRPQELAITLLGAYVRPDPRPVWSGGIVQLLEEFGFSTSAARATLSRLVDRGYLRRVRNGRLVSYKITKHCEEVLIEGEQRIDDPDQAWLLGELIRYLDDKRSGCAALDGMGSSWTKVREGVRAQSLRRKNDPGLMAVIILSLSGQLII